MALLSRKKKTEEKNDGASKALSLSVAKSSNAHVLLRPRITEKASMLASEGNVYVFEVDMMATKKDVKNEVVRLYKVTPLKVAVVPIKRKQVIVRGKYGQTSGGKKAYVYLKKGDKIEFI